MTTTSPSIPMISVTCVTRRVPSRNLEMWTTMSSADAICSRIARIGSSMPAMSDIVSILDNVSRGVLECTVVIEPS